MRCTFLTPVFAGKVRFLVSITGVVVLFMTRLFL